MVGRGPARAPCRAGPGKNIKKRPVKGPDDASIGHGRRVQQSADDIVGRDVTPLLGREESDGYSAAADNGTCLWTMKRE
ncbi:hypothetical protein J6590_072091 [Homalodisca vitripennis]|nr:hypothetical protein J6590_072091 [Homalodisca vitripennis]